MQRVSREPVLSMHAFWFRLQFLQVLQASISSVTGGVVVVGGGGGGIERRHAREAHQNYSPEHVVVAADNSAAGRCWSHKASKSALLCVRFYRK